MKIRVFLALELPYKFRLELKERIDKEFAQHYHPVKTENIDRLHITLRFIGDMEQDKVQVLMEILNNEIKPCKFSCRTNKFGYFKKGGKPAILWANVLLTPEPNELLLKITEILSRLGYETEEYEFVPHITIQRIRDSIPTAVLSKIVSAEDIDISCEIRSFVLFESKLLRSGSVYSPLLKISSKL